MRQVAELAGVSMATVSFVINGTKPVREDTRRRVEAAIASLGYRRNASARALASRRTRMIALAHPQLSEFLSTTLFEFIASASATAHERGYHLILAPSDHEGEELVSLVDEGLVDGVLLMGVLLEDPRVDQLRAMNVPFAMIGRTANPAGTPHVDIDFDATVLDVLEYLSSLGHRHVALVSEPASRAHRSGGASRTREAFIAHAARLGLSSHAYECEASAAAGRELVVQVIEDRPQTTAIITQNEWATFGVLAGLRQMGLKVPTDVSAVSISTTPTMGTLVDPQLTISHVPGTTLGSLGIRAVIDILERGIKAPPTLVPCTLEIGASTALVRTPI